MGKQINGWFIGAGKYNKKLFENNQKEYFESPQSCLNCKKLLEYAPEHKRVERKFCGKSCSAKYNNLIRIKKNFYKKGLTKISKCIICHAKIEISINTPKIFSKCEDCKNKDKLINKKPKKIIFCSICNQEIKNKKRTTCGDKCAKLAKIEGSKKGGKKSAELQSKIRRSKNEIYLAELCKKTFKDIETNKAIFNGWDADIILHKFKIAILWNGNWHYKQITKNHSLRQVQNRDKIKVKEIQKCGYLPYIIKDNGKFNKNFVEKQFTKLCNFIKVSG